MNAIVRRRAQRRRLVLPFVPIVFALLLAGCGGAGEQSSSGAADMGGAAAPHEAAPEAARTDADGSGAGTAAGADVNVSERAVIHSASLSVRVDDLDAAGAEAKKWVRSTGGYIAAEYASSPDAAAPTAEFTFKVPVDRYEEGLEELAGLGRQLDLDRQAQDVTEEVADVDSRVASAEASLERLLALLDDAETVEEVLKIEAQVSTRQADLESLLARQESLADLTSFSTVQLNLSLPSSAAPEADRDSPGFVGGLSVGWRGLLSTVDFLSVTVGLLLPFLVVIALFAVPALWVLRRTRGGLRRTRPAPGNAPPSGAAPQPAAEPGSSQGHASAESPDGTDTEKS
ncbi:DUF4349 domain-containing protein [Nocardiopsis ansamitocini]|uniref:DUF4349 domain-containing protein n=1 Tax=Nocardiopsis ansamitocini TaxID=1670832 RepID=A0A9W6P8B8_9ACTN|nr:DUF4349 domain-containing protein [Nocardiopsis ansamitocini]GLU48971.1 hypothetical protein Nans01_33220 [Nocardiopsis ansamitocini]